MAKDEEHRIHANTSDTQPFDDDSSSHSSNSLSLSLRFFDLSFNIILQFYFNFCFLTDLILGQYEDDKENRFFEDTVPFDDDETQAVDLGDETEVFDDIAGETQKFDDFDTELLGEGYESDGTEVLEDVDDEGVDDHQCRDSGGSADREDDVNRSFNERSSDEKHTSSGN